jgi:hypothetical protein
MGKYGWSPLIANYLKPPQEIITKCEPCVEKIQKLFKLEEVKGENCLRMGKYGWSPLIANYLKPPQEEITKCEPCVEKIEKLFKLEEVKWKEDRTGEKLFKDG